MRRVVLVTGPPCAGKTRHVQQHAQPGDLILDQDVLGQRRMTQALAQVAAMPDDTAWVIRCAPGPRVRRDLAEQIGATERVHLLEDQATLIHRAARRPNPRRHIAAVNAWFVREASNPGPPKPRAPKPKLSSTARGYGWEHQQARADALRDLRDGDACSRCGGAMYRSQAALLDLDHRDDRHGYRGLAHRRCNRQAGQQRGQQLRVARARVAVTTTSVTPVRSRSW